MIRIIRALLTFLVLFLTFCVALSLYWNSTLRHKALSFLHLPWCFSLARIAGCNITVHGTPPTTPHLLVSNHISWHDIIVIGSLFKTNFLSKAEVEKWPLIGISAASAGTLFIPRGANQYRQARAAISKKLSNKSVVVFPEGTTTDGTSVRPFFYHLLQSAAEAEVPILPVSIHYPKHTPHPIPFIGKELTFISHLWQTLPLATIPVHVYFGDPITATLPPKQLAKQLHQQVLDNLGRLKQSAQAAG